MTSVILVVKLLVSGASQIVEVPYQGTYPMCSMSRMILAREWIEKNEPGAKVQSARCRILER